MKRLIEQRYVVRRNFLTILGVCLTVYFCWHIVAGERGMIELKTLNHQVEKITKAYDEVHDRRVALEARVVKLRPGSIDPDLLEERARAELGWVRPDEHIVILQN